MGGPGRAPKPRPTANELEQQRRLEVLRINQRGRSGSFLTGATGALGSGAADALGQTLGVG